MNGRLQKVFSIIVFQDRICSVSSVVALLCCVFISFNQCGNVPLAPGGAAVKVCTLRHKRLDNQINPQMRGHISKASV